MDKKLFTVPNFLSLLRIFMIPVIVRLYMAERFVPALFVLALSGLTDIADGYIARHFNMVSNFGKVIDPTADKLTQVSVLLCLSFKIRALLPLVILLVVKETALALLGIIVLRETGAVKSAGWHGKLAAALLYLTMAMHIAVPEMNTSVTHALVITAGAAMLLSFILYVRRSINLLHESRTPKAGENTLSHPDKV